MKAIVMAGGEGTRLKPLTCCMPKPMVRLLDKPLVEYTVEHLEKHGIVDLAFTLMYMPSSIIGYFDGRKGVNIEYYIENEPLGTAGSVKNASGFVDGAFLIISGDALCDIDVTDAAVFHKNTGATATIILKKMGEPLEYGVVISNGDGRVERFLEKPGWEDVFSDTVNTGIYILEPEVLELIPEGKRFDFAKDLFPLMLRKGMRISGYVASGYWCDVGNIESYIKAHEDLLRGEVNVKIDAKNASGVYVGEGADISNSALIQAPCYIGPGAVIGEGARIGMFSAVGKGARVASRCNIKRSVLLEGASASRNVKLSGCVVAAGSSIGERSSVYEGAVIGERCVLSGDNTVSPRVKIWPDKRIGEGVSVNENIVWGYGERAGFLGKNGFTGDTGADLTPLRLGRIFGAAAEYMSGKSVALSSDGADFSNAVIKQAAGIFTQSGVDVFTMNGAVKPVCAQVAQMLGAGLCVSVRTQKQNKLSADIYEPSLYLLSKDARKKIESKYFAQGERIAHRACGRESVIGAAEELYTGSVYGGFDAEAIKKAGLCVAVRGGREIDAFASRVLSKCGVRIVDFNADARGVGRGEDAAFAASVNRSGASCALYLPDGGVVDEDGFASIVYYLIFASTEGGEVKLPSGVSRSAVSLAQMCGLKVSYVSEEESLLSMSIDSRRMLFDGVYALCRLALHMARTGTTIAGIASMFEPRHRRVREINCGWDDIGRVIKTVYQQGGAEAGEGLRMNEENGYGYICPHPTHPKIMIRTEGFSEEFAEELCEKYSDMVKKILKK